MALTPKKVYQGSPSTTLQTIHTVPTSQKTIVKNIILTNITENEAVVHVYVVPSGQTQLSEHELLAPLPISPLDTRFIELSYVLEVGDSIQVKQNTSGAINVFVSGIEVV